MEVVESLDTFGGRLYNAFKIKGYDLKDTKSHAMKRIIQDMLDQGLKEDPDNIRRRITDDVKYKLPIPRLNSSQLKLYCDFLGCSADYLLGIIPETTHTITDIKKNTGLSPAAVSKLLQADKDTQVLYDRLIAGGYLDNLVSAMNTFYDFGSSVQINGEKVTDKDTIADLEKAIDGIKLKHLRNTAADTIHQLAYDKSVSKHFLSSRIDLYNKKVKAIHKDNPLALKAWNEQFKDFKKDMLSILD